jgi:hypothetical protein
MGEMAQLSDDWFPTSLMVMSATGSAAFLITGSFPLAVITALAFELIFIVRVFVFCRLITGKWP